MHHMRITMLHVHDVRCQCLECHATATATDASTATLPVATRRQATVYRHPLHDPACTGDAPWLVHIPTSRSSDPAISDQRATQQIVSCWSCGPHRTLRAVPAFARPADLDRRHLPTPRADPIRHNGSGCGRGTFARGTAVGSRLTQVLIATLGVSHVSLGRRVGQVRAAAVAQVGVGVPLPYKWPLLAPLRCSYIAHAHARRSCRSRRDNLPLVPWSGDHASRPSPVDAIGQALLSRPAMTSGAVQMCARGVTWSSDASACGSGHPLSPAAAPE